MATKQICIVLNVLLIVVVVCLVAGEGQLPSPDDKDFWLLIVFLAAPISTLVYLFGSGNSKTGFSNTLLGLYFQRKALEEKQKIKELSGHENS